MKDARPIKNHPVKNAMEVLELCWLCVNMWFALSGAEEASISTDEDAPYRDDLNDQSYDPKEER